ncbi:ABC transporter FGM5 [Cladobotryum mycophilum]|uniref:ABC transporter FGM5 n=1 Tax=Cladobotryum mycophilum TaxID=491253 RepID=A0ABR0SX60_9HYPO
MVALKYSSVGSSQLPFPLQPAPPLPLLAIESITTAASPRAMGGDNSIHHGDCIDGAAFGFAHSCATSSTSVSPSPSDFPIIEYMWIFWMSIATAALFVALAIPRVLHLSRRRSISRAPAIFLASKLIVAATFAGLRLGLLIIAVRLTSLQTTKLVASTALDFAAACFLLALSPLEHFKSHRPSILDCSFLFVNLIYDLARCPVLWDASRDPGTDGDYGAFPGLFMAAIVAEFVFLVLESTQRKRWVAWEAADHSPEETSSILSLGLYSWLSPMLWRGYHEPLTMQNLFALDKAISVERLEARNMYKTSEESTGTSTWQLVLWLAKPLGPFVLLPIFPRLCLLGFTFCQPFFLQRLLLFLSDSDDDSTTASGLVAVAILTYFGIAISTALYWYYQERFQSLLRSFLISSIYRKTRHIQHVGDGDSAAITLMGADVERIYTGIRLIHEVWANAIQIALASWLLHKELGLAFLAPLIVVLLGFAASFGLSKRVVPYQGAWMGRVQQRIGATSAVLANIKDLRVSGMTNPAAALVQHEREEDLRVGERSRMLIAISASISQLPSAVAPALAFAFGPHAMGETRAFTALSFLALLTSPLMVVLQSIPIIAACVACLRRIKLFLIKVARVDGRLLERVDGVSDNTQNKDVAKEAFVAVQNGSFGWSAEKSVLKDVNLSLPKSSFTFVVGPVASGKSTLCRALLGEVPYAQGNVILRSDKLAYCDQTPFVFNATIMENIVGFSSYDAARYADVIHAAMLNEDLGILPAGDQTIIGSKGVSLSGGQRQRVSLARALYHDADILVLDDVFSGLDGSTQDQVCQAVFGLNGLLRKRGTTVLICTHSTHSLPAADYIVSLSTDGTIVDQGSVVEIFQDEERSRRVGLVGAPDFIAKLETSDAKTSEMAIETTNTVTASTSRARIEPPVTKAPPAPVPSQTVDMDVYRHWLSTIGPLPLVFYFILILGIGFCSNFPTIWVKLWSADSVSANPEHSFAFWMGIYALFGSGVVICVFPAGIIVLRTAVRLSGTTLHHTAIETVMHSSLRFLTSTDVGKILNLFSQDMNIMDTQLPRMVNNMCICLFIAIGQAVVIAVSSGWLAISYPFFMALLWAVQRVYLPSSKRLRILDLESKTPLYTNFLDTVSGLPTIRAFGWFPHQLARNNALLDDSQRPSYLLAMAQQWLTLTMNMIVAILAVILVVLATQLGSEAGNVGAGLVTLITLGATLTTIVVAYTGLETSLGAISRLKSFGEDTEQEDPKREDLVPDKSWPMSGRVQLQDMEASYDGTDKVLKGLTLTVEAGQKVSICGRTGSGKSSVLSLLLRLIDPLPTNASPILIDDHPLSTIDRTALRERIISASQDAIFLPKGTSFKTNLDPWAMASDAECNTVLRDLDLAAVVEAKGGLDAAVNGAELSAGQKQLFSLARAVLRRRVKQRETNTDGGLLLLDEITSSADAETERRVQRVLDEEFSAYTMVMVTHRREMAMACDRVIVLDAGKVVEDGNPVELLEKEKGWFKALWAGQNSS